MDIENAYDFAFNLTGDIFTFDSDGERDVSLPWYQPARVFQMTPGSHAGWVSNSWKRPEDLPDMPPVLASFDRASPSGLVCYRHQNFPSRYDGALLMLDWTFGRVLAVSMEEQRGNWTGKPVIFAKASGKFGFAPTDLVVAPDGNLFVSVGGRGTRGSVYRIVYEPNEGRETFPSTPGDSMSEKLDYVLDAPQPLASWSRARWYPVAKDLGRNQFIAAATDEGRKPVQRVRAIEVLTDVFDGIDPVTTRLLLAARSVPVRARAAWAVGRTNPERPNSSAVFTLLNDQHPLVQRNTLEALLHSNDTKLFDRCLPRLAVTLDSTDTAVRYATSTVIPRLSKEQQETLSSLISHSQRSQIWMALGLSARTNRLNLGAARTSLKTLQQRDVGPDQKLEALRLLQIAFGDVGPQKSVAGMFESYTSRASLEEHELQLNPVRTLIASEFPSGNRRYDRELLRTISMLGSLNRDLIGNILEQITDKSLPPDDIHRLATLTRINAPRTNAQTQETARALVNLEYKIQRMGLKQDSNWDDRVAELYKTLAVNDSEIPAAVAANEGLGLPGHVFLLSQIPEDQLQTAIDGFARQAMLSDDYQWSTDVVFVLGRSRTPDHINLVRQQIDNLAVQDAVLIVMARTPRAQDRPTFLAGLDSTQIRAVEECTAALLKLPKNNEAPEQYRLLLTAQRMDQDERQYAVRESLMRLLQNNMQQSFGFVFGKDGYRPQPEAFDRWMTYLKKRFPDQEVPIDGGKLAMRVLSVLDEVHWHNGNADRGEELFAKLSCTRCHSGRKALGPDLEGVAKRYSRPDLFAAIVDPNRDVPNRYQMTNVVTKDGRQYSGLVVYESVDGLILRDAEQNTYRIEANDIEVKAAPTRFTNACRSTEKCR